MCIKSFQKYFMVCGNVVPLCHLNSKSRAWCKHTTARQQETCSEQRWWQHHAPRLEPGIFITFQIPVKFGTKASGRSLKMKINLTFQRNNKNVHPNRWKAGFTGGTSKFGNGAWTVVQVDIFGLLRVVCTENVLPVWQIWSASVEKSGQILPELIDSRPNRQRNILLHSQNHPYLVPDKWESFQPRIAAAHVISKRTNLFLERYPVGFASPSQFDIARKWGWLDRRKEPDEKSASWKSLSFILKGPGTREADIVSQKSTISVGFLFKQEMRILRFRAWFHARLGVATPPFATLPI